MRHGILQTYKTKRNNCASTFSDLVQYGFPSPAADYIEQRIALIELLVSSSRLDILRKAVSDLIVEAGINPV